MTQRTPAPAVIKAARRRAATPTPLYSSWADFTSRANPREVRKWCAEKAKKANTRAAERGITATIDADDVFATLLAAHGRCSYCGSLAVETIPSGPDGKSLPCRNIGRRIGSLDHVEALYNRGANDRSNLAWACMLCNSGKPRRILGATDHGAVQADGPDDSPPCEGPVVNGMFTFRCSWCA